MSNRTSPHSILIVEDDPTLRTLARHLLVAQGHHVLCASDGLFGLAALKVSLPDLIISDLDMPNMNGFEFLSIVRRRFPFIPVIVVSGEFTELSDPESVLADAFFPKGGYPIHTLFATVNLLIERPPVRQHPEKPRIAAVWVRYTLGTVTVSCTDCLRTSPVDHTEQGIHAFDCAFCGAHVPFEIRPDRRQQPRESSAGSSLSQLSQLQLAPDRNPVLSAR